MIARSRSDGSRAPAASFLRELAPFVWLCLSTLACVGTQAGTGADARDLVEADRLRAAAMVAADPEALRVRLDPELSYTHSTGTVDSRESLIASLSRGAVDYLSIESPNPRVTLRGHVGVVTGPVDMRVAAGGRIHEVRSVYTAVYSRSGSDDRWRLVAYQSTSRGDATSAPSEGEEP